MAPPVSTFHVSQLPTQINSLPNGKPRKPHVQLDEGAEKEVVQYRCNIEKVGEGKNKKPVIICEPVVRFYRQFEDGLMVETSTWNEWKENKTHEGG